MDNVVRLPGFEPGSSTWQADVLNQARLQPLACCFRFLNQHFWFFSLGWFWLKLLTNCGKCYLSFLCGLCVKGNFASVFNPVEAVLQKLYFFFLCPCFPNDVLVS